jgi:hypothetical protein
VFADDVVQLVLCLPEQVTSLSLVHHSIMSDLRFGGGMAAQT